MIYNNEHMIFSISGVEDVDEFKTYRRVGTNFAFGRPFVDQQGILAISLPLYSSEFALLSGEVVLISIDNLQGNYQLNELDALSVLIANDSNIRFGQELLFDDINSDGFDDLIISAPLFNLDDLYGEIGTVGLWLGGPHFPTGVVLDCLQTTSWQSQGLQFFGRFGSSIAIMSLPEHSLVVGEPRYNNVNMTADMAGCVHIFTI